MPTENGKTKVDIRIEVAAKLLLEHSKRTPKQQLNIMNRKLGLNKGGNRERLKLNSLISSGLGDLSFFEINDRTSKKNKAKMETKNKAEVNN